MSPVLDALRTAFPTWQDPIMAVLLGMGLWSTYLQVRNPLTQISRRASLLKAASAGGLGILQITLGLWLTATISATYFTAFIFQAIKRPILEVEQHGTNQPN